MKKCRLGIIDRHSPGGSTLEKTSYHGYADEQSDNRQVVGGFHGSVAQILVLAAVVVDRSKSTATNASLVAVQHAAARHHFSSQSGAGHCFLTTDMTTYT